MTTKRDSKSKSRRTHSRKFAALLACCVAASAVLAGHAWAGQIFQENSTFHHEGTAITENKCGVEGLTVSDEYVLDVRFSVAQRGPDGFAYGIEHVKVTTVSTNLANGKSITLVEAGNMTDLKVTDNGDGTLTILVLAAGNTVLYGSDGKAIARNPGQVRFEVLLDHSGTPTDPRDDEFIAFLGLVKGSTGRNDDLCAAAVEALN